jgi:lipopolysaccharide/colanic/teichoic acid biosynthesis glycosyltransferase
MTRYERFIKRFFDVCVSFVGIAILWPLFVLLALVIKLSSKGPVFFTQIRVGRHGKHFTCIKFRTMYTDSHKESSVTTAYDSRITPVGHFLRKFKLDEFSQLLNVFIGKMSFVGPRPDVPGYADKLKGDERAILYVRPGITGPASIYFRDEDQLLEKVNNPKEYNDTVIWPKKVEINLNYIKNWSFFEDLGYIIVTLVPWANKWLKIGKGLK